MIAREFSDQADADRPLPRLSAVVCTHERYALAEKAVDSLLRQEVEPGFLEIVIVDNSPQTDEAARFAARYASRPSVHCLRQEPLGLSRARNLGLSRSRAPIVAFLDDDVIVAAPWAAEMVAAFDAFGPQAGAVGGRVKPAWLSSKPDWLHGDLLGFLSIVDWGDTLRIVAPDEWLAGCNIAYRREALTATGGFSPALGRNDSKWSLLSNEEIQVTQAIRARGSVVGYAPAALVEHWIDPARLQPEWFVRRAAWQAVSDLMLNDETAAARIASAEQRMVTRATWKQKLAMRLLMSRNDDRDAVQSNSQFIYDYVLGLLAGAHQRRQPP